VNPSGNEGGEMLRSKYFWIAIVILVPFIVVWVMYGIAWAIGMLVVLAVLFLFVSGSISRSRTRRRYDYDDDEDYEEGGRSDIYIHSRTVRCDHCDGTGRVPSLYIPFATVKCRRCDGTGWLYD